MKKVIWLLPCALFPYSLFAGLYYFLQGMGNLGESFSFLPWMFGAAFVCNVIFLVLSMGQKWDCRKMALWNMVIKLMQIPAYLGIFLLGIVSFSLIFTIGVAGVLFLFDCASIFLTGMIGVGAVIRCCKSGVCRKTFSVLHGILQFVFCLDLISAILVFARSKLHRPSTRGDAPTQ